MQLGFARWLSVSAYLLVVVGSVLDQVGGRWISVFHDPAVLPLELDAVGPHVQDLWVGHLGRVWGTSERGEGAQVPVCPMRVRAWGTSAKGEGAQIPPECPVRLASAGVSTIGSG